MCSPTFGRPHFAVEAYASAARTADPTAVEVANVGNFNACLIFVSVTDSAATPSVVFNFDIHNKKADTWVEVLDSAAVTGASENVYMLGAKAESADATSTFPPTDRIRIRPVHADGDSITYSVSVFWFRA